MSLVSWINNNAKKRYLKRKNNQRLSPIDKEAEVLGYVLTDLKKKSYTRTHEQ